MPSPSIDLSFLRAPGVGKRIGAIIAAFALLGIGYSFLAPRWYESVLTVAPAKQQKSGISSLLGGEMGGLAASLDVAGVGGGGADAQRILAVLKSTAVSDAVISRFDLKSRYGQKYQEGAREELWRHCEAKAIVKPNLVTLACEDRDPRFVQQLLGAFAEVGNEVFQRVNVGTAAEEVQTMEKRVAELRDQADEVASRMRTFQEKHQIVDLDSQARALVSSVALLNSQRIAKQMELDYAQRFASPDESSSRQLRSQLSVVDEQLREMELPEASAPGGSSAARPQGKRRGSGLLPAALEVPALRAEFEKLYRDRKVVEATLIFALDRLETARAAKAREVSTFVVMDPPAVPERRSRPRPAQTIVTFLLVGVAVALGWEWWRAHRVPGAAARG